MAIAAARPVVKPPRLNLWSSGRWPADLEVDAFRVIPRLFCPSDLDICPGRFASGHEQDARGQPGNGADNHRTRLAYDFAAFATAGAGARRRLSDELREVRLAWAVPGAPGSMRPPSWPFTH